jgi:hypothetical protein
LRKKVDRMTDEGATIKIMQYKTSWCPISRRNWGKLKRTYEVRVSLNAYEIYCDAKEKKRTPKECNHRKFSPSQNVACTLFDCKHFSSRVCENSSTSMLWTPRLLSYMPSLLVQR